MTAKKCPHALAVAPAALALLAGTADASRTPTAQTPMRDSASVPATDSKPIEPTAVPNGEEIDARDGRVLLTLLLTVLHDAGGRLDQARFFAGRFIFS